MKKEIFKNRTRQIRGRMSENKIEALLIIKPANVTYATGFGGHDSWALVTQANTYLITDSRYSEQAYTESPNCRIVQRTGSLPAEIAKVLKKLKSIKTIAVENTVPVTTFKALKKSITGNVKTSLSIIEDIRTCKDDSEIAAIKKAGLIAAQALAAAMGQIESQMTESHLAGLIDLEIRKLGSKNSFETIVAFGPNASKPHHQPTTRKLKKNDTILIDFGAIYKGYCSDITRCFTIGSPSAFYQKVYNAVKRAQAAAIKTIKPGIEIDKVDAAARKVIAEAGLTTYGHGTGHGLGLEVHELPVVSGKTKGKLLPGQVITIEPGVYIPNKLGVRIEDDILVTKTGHQILTQNC